MGKRRQPKTIDEAVARIMEALSLLSPIDRLEALIEARRLVRLEMENPKPKPPTGWKT